MIDFPYLILVSTLFFFSNFGGYGYKNKYFTSIVVVTFCFIAFRAPVVGADTYSYVQFFSGAIKEYSSSDFRDLEFIFLIYNRILGLISRDGIFYLFLNTIFCLMPVHYLIKKYSLNATLSILLFFLLDIYVSYFVALRQVLSLSLLLYGLIIIHEKRNFYFLKFFIISCVCYYIHNSSVLVSFVFMFTYFIKLKNRYLSILLIIGSLIFGISLGKLGILKILEIIAQQKYSFLERNEFYLLSEETQEKSLNIVFRLSLIGVFVFGLIQEKRINHWFSKIFLFGIIIFNIFYSFPMILRVVTPFILFSIIVFTWVFEEGVNIRILSKKYILIFSFVIQIYFLRSFFISNINPDLSSLSKLHPYYFFFENYSNHPSLRKF